MALNLARDGITTMQDEASTETPERNLLAATLERALLDLRNVDNVLPHVRREAWTWFNSTGRHEWSFRWLCFQLGLDYQIIFKAAVLVKNGYQLSADRKATPSDIELAKRLNLMLFARHRIC